MYPFTLNTKFIVPEQDEQEFPNEPINLNIIIVNDVITYLRVSQRFYKDKDEFCFEFNTISVNLPYSLYSYIDGVRKAPDSWTSLEYHNHCTFSTTDENGKKMYIRFRLVGRDDTKYRLDEHEQKTFRYKTTITVLLYRHLTH